MEDTTSPTFGMNRRELLKRGAVVGALTWAAPAVSSLGSPAFAQTGTPALDEISFVAMCVSVDGTSYEIKWETDVDCFVEPNGDCGIDAACPDDNNRWDDCDGAGGGGVLGSLVTDVSVSGDCVTFTFASDVTLNSYAIKCPTCGPVQTVSSPTPGGSLTVCDGDCP